ncbi:hypothetical protein [Chryseobacterium sp. OSA05B]|uniref:hypothetical protein n=1 Tax=Chryseobacterium sp. OSA05B TaxID=2862650 RepID=UPI001CBF043F|nr:hypothetical protein [Chryseobacterium sp. OSA05B]
MFPFLSGLNDGTKIVGLERAEVARSMHDVTKSWKLRGYGNFKAFQLVLNEVQGVA